MVAIIGLVVVIASVIGGFLMVKGHILTLFQPNEYITIGGAAIGGVIVGTPGVLLVALANKIKNIFIGKPVTKDTFLDLLKILFELFDLGRKDGLLALEGHAEEPDKSALFQKYPSVAANREAVDFLCDSMKMLVGGAGPHELEELMELSIEIKEEEAHKFSAILQGVADALPGLGIVAAVLGIIITMGHMSEGAEVVGHHVASALVGTFLGVLLAYGFVGPLANNLGIQGQLELQYMACIKHGLIAFSKGNTAAVSVEFSRRSIFSDYRPGFKQVEEACKALRGAAKSE
ncbi:MAG: flagellar motor stator protein MotA [Candidatus Eremiobacterota bacterium]